MLLSKNADVSIKESNIEGNKLVTDRKWAAPEAVWEIVEAISNYTVLTYYIRNYSYEGLAISRAYHDMGFFLGTVSSEKEQMTLLEDSFNKLLSRNSNRAKNQTHCHPLTYEEVKGALNSFLHSKGKHETGLYGESDISDLKPLYNLAHGQAWTRMRARRRSPRRPGSGRMSRGTCSRI